MLTAEQKLQKEKEHNRQHLQSIFNDDNAGMYFTNLFFRRCMSPSYKMVRELVGPTVYIPANPLCCFSLFFYDDLIDTIVLEKNRYAEQVYSSQETPAHWRTNAEEIHAYFGFFILMGIIHLPEVQDYWSSNTYLHAIADRISHDRFEQISRYLHFTNNETLPQRCQPGYSRLEGGASDICNEEVLSAIKAWVTI